ELDAGAVKSPGRETNRIAKASASEAAACAEVDFRSRQESNGYKPLLGSETFELGRLIKHDESIAELAGSLRDNRANGKGKVRRYVGN
ncbi:hypothetical protein, partial [Salmonella enterica]|uniref:hypothetical protein n=1 Tax=Salmonella enterica TaxID=28901 RepID=UPI003CE7F680